MAVIVEEVGESHHRWLIALRSTSCGVSEGAAPHQVVVADATRLIDTIGVGELSRKLE